MYITQRLELNYIPLLHFGKKYSKLIKFHEYVQSSFLFQLKDIFSRSHSYLTFPRLNVHFINKGVIEV